MNSYVDQNPSPPSTYKPRPGIYLDWRNLPRCGCGATQEPVVIEQAETGAALHQCPACRRVRWIGI